MSNSLIIIPVVLTGPRASRTLPMIVDTGASGTIIPPRVAFDIGCDPEQSSQRVPIITASALTYLPVVKLLGIRALGVSAENFEVVCHDLPAESTVQGLLGLDFLRFLTAFQEFEKKIRDLIHL